MASAEAHPDKNLTNVLDDFLTSTKVERVLNLNILHIYWRLCGLFPGSGPGNVVSMVTVLKRHNIPVAVLPTRWSCKWDVTRRDESRRFRMSPHASGCDFSSRHEPYDVEKWGRVDGKRLGTAPWKQWRTWARVALPDNELLSAMLLYVLSVSPSLSHAQQRYSVSRTVVVALAQCLLVIISLWPPLPVIRLLHPFIRICFSLPACFWKGV